MGNEGAIAKKLEKHSLTPFQFRVLMATAAIPEGEVRTYKQIAIEAGHPGAYRAVGSVMRNNPLPILIPCHRVVRSNGDPGRYSAAGGRKRKIELLLKEGYLTGAPHKVS
jgi:methylated-DNA-[protein]-cysteine S-methyltransferase